VLYLNIAMSQGPSRDNWNFLYEKGLIEILIDHMVDTRFEGQNGWRSVKTKLNKKFPLAHFTKQELQDKEKNLIGSYIAICGAKSEWCGLV
jgi:hypothetical protein